MSVERFSEVSDSVCVGQRRGSDGEERVVLFLRLCDEQEEVMPLLTKRLVKVIREQLSARHVPAVILPISDIPVS